MREYFSLSDLSGLPGLPITRRGVAVFAARAHWPFRKRQASGGGREYHVSCLPESARLDLMRREADRYIQTRPPKIEGIDDLANLVLGEKAKALSSLPPRYQRLALARYIVVQSAKKFSQSAFVPKWPGWKTFSELYNAGSFPVEAFASSEVKKVSAATLYNWSTALDAGGVIALAGKPRSQKGK